MCRSVPQMDAASMRTSTSSGSRCRDGHLLEREPGGGLALADGAHRLHCRDDLATGERPAGGRYDRARAGAFCSIDPGSRGALRQPARAAAAPGRRRRRDRRLPRRARRAQPARSRDAARARAHVADRPAGALRRRSPPRPRRPRKPAPHGYHGAVRGRSSADSGRRSASSSSSSPATSSSRTSRTSR